MAKAILLVRVSTEAQNYDEQERQLHDMAVADGYADDDIIHIAEKESGAKLTEEQRKGLNRMKEIIATENVAVVYAWEISRIARKKKILFNILDLLQQKQIQLKIREPNIALLNDDGTVNYAAETTFTLFAQMAESEMRTKVARFKRTKSLMAKQGKWVGGNKPRYGYRVDEDGFYKIKDEEADVIRLIYRLYTTTDMGYSRLSHELATYGHHLTARKINSILSDKSYTGHTDEEKRPDGNFYRERTWPVIIDGETWAKAEQKRNANDTEKNKSSNYFFGAKLIVCPECGRHYVSFTSSGTYQCMGRSTYHDCGNHSCILINALDSILWFDAQEDLRNSLVADRDKKFKEYEQQIADLTTKLMAAEKTVNTVENRLEKVGENYELGIYTKETALKKRDEIQASAQEAKRQIAQFNANIEKIKSILANMADADNIIDRYNRVAEGVANIDDYREMYEIVHTYIQRVEVCEEPIMGVKCTKKITVTHTNGEISTYYFMYHRKKGCRYWVEPNVNNDAIQKELKAKGDFYFPLDDGSGDFKELNRVPRKKRYVRVADR